MAQPPPPSVLSASRVMASGTVVSRLTGLFRALLLVAAIGNVGAHPDIFNVANTIPNSLYILVAGGVFNAVLVPQLVRATRTDADGGDAYANRIITLGALVLASVTVVLMLFAPVLLRLLASSYFTDPSLAAEKESLVVFARYCLPQIFFYGMFVLVGQILNARDKFGPMMWTPIANNLISIAVLTGYLLLYDDTSALPQGRGGYSSHQELLLGIGSTVGIAAQTLLLLPYLRRAGFKVRPRLDFRGTGLGHTMRLARWTVGFVVVNQLAFYVMVHRATNATAEAAKAAGYTVYANAFLLTQLPHSIVTVSLATATIPLVSRLAAEGRMREMADEMRTSLRLVLSVIVPFAAALLVLGPALATVLFGYGQGAGDTRTLGITIVAFAPGLLMFSIHYMVLRGFYAIEDTRTPFVIQCVVAAVNVALAIALTILFDPLYAAPALALAYGASYTAGALLSTRLLSRRLSGGSTLGLTRFVLRVTAAALPAAGLAWVSVRLLAENGLGTSDPLDAGVLLAVGGIVGLAVYLGLARLLRIQEIGRIVSTLRPRRSGPGGSHVGILPPPTMGQEQHLAHERGTRREAGGEDVAAHPVEPGVVLAERYALEDLLAQEGDATTWRARDRVLARSVVLQIIPSSSPAAAEMLASAKRASRVADPRILQVLDAVDDGELSYVVREWTNGQSLEVVLAEGPMSARRSTFLLREVAGAISTAHKMGLRHRRLAPDTVVLTKSSGVKVLGLGTLAALRTDPAEMGDPELADTRDLGRLLYACLTARWPGGSAGTLPAAPTEHGKLLRPRQVRAGVPRTLDVLCDRILGNPPRGGEPITTVDEVKNALSAILTNDGFSESSTLRMSEPETPEPSRRRLEPPPAVLSPDDGGPMTGDKLPVVPVSPRPRSERSTVARTLRWVVLLLLGLGALLLLYAIASRLPTGNDATPGYVTSTKTGPSGTPPTTPGSTPPGALQPIQIASADDFDPPPLGSGDENPALVPLAIDGDPATSWTTLKYFDGRKFGGIKPGVGLVLDLGSAKQVSKVKVTLVGTSTSLELRAAPADATTAPSGSVADYPVVSPKTAAGTDAAFSLPQPVKTRFLLVWLTSLPRVTGGYQGEVAEIQVLG
ncbi:MAG: murein biosynthesis integral membrane protein MurJ [Nocardioidaceae bacterium]